jgi:predicted  nucleic acid-binding Zn-ribbon protein
VPHECTTCGRQFADGSKEMLSGCPNCGGNKFQFQPGARDDAEAASSAAGEALPSPDADEVAEADVEREMPEITTESDTAAENPEVSSADSTAADASAGAEAADADRASEFDAELGDAEIDEEVGDEDSAQSDARGSAASIDEIDEARRKMAEAEEERLSETGSGGRGTPQGPPTDSPRGESDEFDISGAVGPEDDDPVEKQPVAGSAPEREDPTTDDSEDLSALREELNDQFESIKITAPGQYELNLMELYDRKEYIISLQEDGRYVIEMADDYGMEDA